jgi:hypothetical protein
MHAWVIATVFAVAPVLWAAHGIAAPGEDLHRPDQLESFEQDPSQRQAGEFRLKLFPQGKSRSQEHVSAEGSFRFAPDGDQREFTLRFKSSKHPQDSFLRSTDDFI